MKQSTPNRNDWDYGDLIVVHATFENTMSVCVWLALIPFREGGNECSSY